MQHRTTVTRRAAPFFGLAGILAACAGACGGEPSSGSTEAPVSQSRQAAFVNTDFENDTGGVAPASWAISRKLYFGYGDTAAGSSAPPASLAALDLRDSPNGGFTAAFNTFAMSGANASQRDADLVAKYPTAANDFFRFPKYGTKSAVINYNATNRGNANALGRNHNANVMTQTMTLGVQDIDADDGQFHVRFVYAPIVQSGGHELNQQPFVALRLTKVGTGAILYEDFVAASTRGAPWLATGTAATDPYYYGPMDPADHVAGWKMVDIIPGSAKVALGDQVQLEVMAAGCYATAHWGRVYVDNFGVGVPDFYVVAQGVQAGNENTDVTYTYIYKNGGTATALGAAVDFAIPANTTFQSVSLPNCTNKTFADPRQAAGLPGGPFPDIRLYTCPVGDVAPGGGGSFKVVVKLDAGTAGLTDVNGHYSSYATNVTPLIGPDIRTVVTTGTTYADVSSTISAGQAAAAVGDALTYTGVVKNAGPSAATNVNVALTASGVTLGAWTCTAAGGAACPAPNGTGAIAHNGVSIPSGGTLTYSAAATAGGAGTGVATLTSTVNAPSDPDASNNAAAAYVQIGTVRTVNVTKGDLGTVRSAPTGIDCGVGCTTQTKPFLDGSTVILEATPPPGGQFLGWTGDCAGTATKCTFTASGNKTVGAKFVGPAMQLSVTGGANQTTAVTTAFAQPLTLRVLDSQNVGIPGANVAFTKPASGASATLATANAVTDANGTVSTTATANTVAGSFAVTATSGALETTFPLTNFEPPGTITVVSGSPQQKVVGNPFDAPLVVEVRDWANAPRANAIVRFDAPSTGATADFAAPVVTTGADGRATVKARAGRVAGTYAVGVVVDNTTLPAPISLTNLAGPVVALRATSEASRQATRVKTAFARPLEVRATDVFGNVVSGADIRFAGPSSEPRADFAASATTDAAGRASVTVTAGSGVGGYLVSAVVAGTGVKADFALENLDRSPIVLSVVAGSPQSAPVGTPFGAELVVVATRDDQPVASQPIAFAAPAQGASATLSAREVVTDAGGRARIAATAGTKAGEYTVVASTVEGASGEGFALGNATGPAANVQIDPLSSPQRARVGTAFANALRARVTDTFGNPVVGAGVTFTPPSTNPLAVLAGTSVVTDADGRASTTASAGLTVGDYAVTASVAGVSPGSFDLGNLAGDPSVLAISGGDGQSTLVSTAFAQPLEIEARALAGTAVAGSAVTFAVAGSGASATVATAPATGADGKSSAIATANAVAGRHLVAAYAAGAAAPVGFFLENLAGAPATLAVLEGSSDQSAFVGSAYPQALRVVVRDASGNPITAAPVAFAPPSSGASARLSDVSPTTDTEGVVEVLGVAAVAEGAFSLPATSGGGSTTLALTNRARPVADPTAGLVKDDGTLEGGGLSCATRPGGRRLEGALGLLVAVGLLAARRRTTRA